jgi:AAA domain
MKRFKKNSRCPICTGFDSEKRGIGRRCHGYLSEDRRYAFCSREEFSGGLPLGANNDAYAHLLEGNCRCGQQHNPPIVTNRVAAIEYNYTDERGELLYQAVRFMPKDFRARRPDGKGDWIWNVEGARRVLYRLTQLLAADRQATVFIVEGEKDADRLASLGCIATTNVFGAGKWRDEYREPLRGRYVAVLADNDEAGRIHAEQVASSLHDIAASVKVIELPDLPDKGDVSDWLDAGGTVEQLQDIAGATELFTILIEQSESGVEDITKAVPTILCETAANLLARNFPEPKWAVGGLLSEGATVFAGAPKVGKSFMALGLAISIASGGMALSSIPVEQGDVLYLALEDGDKRMQKRLKTMLCGGRVPERLNFAYKCPRLDEGGLEGIGGWLQEHPEARLIVVDTLKRIRPQEHRIKRIYDNDYDAVSPLNDLAQQHGVSILIVHHTNKSNGNEDWFDSISGSLGLSGAVDNAMLLKRSRVRQDGTLLVGGRDIEDKELAVEFDGVINGWKLLGDTLTPLARKVHGWLSVAGEVGLTRSEINKKNGGRSEGIEDALAELKISGRADFKMMPTKGKAQQRWYAANLSPTYDDIDDNDDGCFFDDNETVMDELEHVNSGAGNFVLT